MVMFKELVRLRSRIAARPADDGGSVDEGSAGELGVSAAGQSVVKAHKDLS